MFPSSWVLEFKNVHSLFQGKVDLSPISYMCETASHLINIVVACWRSWS